MNLLFLDIYKNSNARLSKDTAGGYGTEADLGNSLVGKFLSFIVKKSIFWPSLSFIQLVQEFQDRNHKCQYHKLKVGENICYDNCDFIFVCSSIVCFETELDLISKIKKESNAHIFLCGTIAEHLEKNVPDEVTILSGNYEFIVQELENNNSSLNNISKERLIKVKNGDPSKLNVINWNRKDLPNNTHKFYSGSEKFLPFIFTRGCPYSCFEYCTYPLAQGRKILQAEVRDTVEKLKKFNTKKKTHIVFRDPVFSINIKKTKMLLEEIGNANLNIEFTAELHLKNIDDEFLQLCKYAKIKWLKFGIESAFEKIRNSVNRMSVTNDEQKEKVDLIKASGIKTHGMFILAQPEDTFETCDETINYATTLNLDVAQFSVFTPYPGTPYFKRDELELDFEKYEDFSQFHLIYKHRHLTKNDARLLLEKGYTKFIKNKILKTFYMA